MRIGAILTLVGAAVAGLLALSVVFGSWYTVDEGTRGIVLRNGEFTKIAEPGLSYKLPIVDDVVHMSTRQQTALFENVAVYSRDQQTANLRISVQYSVPVDKVREVYQIYKTPDNMAQQLINRAVSERAEAVFGQFSASVAISDRGRLSQEMAKAIRDQISGPILIHNVQLENIDFSDAYEQAIEDRMKAEVLVQKEQQNLAREKVIAETVVTQAQAQADSRVAQAEAEAKAITLRGNAEAEAINARGKALRDNPAVIGLTQAERWDGKLPAQMIPNSTVPFLDLKAN